MRSRIARVAVLTLAALGLVATMAPPASATTLKVAVFTGNAQLGGGLGYPCTPVTTPPTTTNCPDGSEVTVKTDAKGLPVVNVNGGNHRGFSFISTACVKVSVSVKTTTPGKQGPALCSITAAGVVWGWCGLSGGMGNATITNLGVPPVLPNTKTQVTTPFKFTGIGGLLYITGGNMTTNIRGVVTAIPAVAVGGPACSNKTATTFTLTGGAVYKDLTV